MYAGNRGLSRVAARVADLLDFRAIWSVSLDVPGQYSFDCWQLYVEFCRGVARAADVDMRTLDRALWQYSKENQAPRS